jgi:hypothetical protein
MADTLATLIIKLVADHAELTTGVKKANTEVDSLADAFAKMDADRPFVRASEAAGSFGASLGQVDRTLSRFGVNLTPMVAAIREMEAALGKTASQLGLVATGGLAVAAGLGGWQLGRAISETFDLDTKIGDLTARLFGLGDVAGETTAAKMDLLARATKIAGHEITIYADAVKIAADESKRLADSLTTPEANMARVRGEVAAAQREFRGLSDEQRINIERMLEWGRSASEVEQLLQLTAGTVDVFIGRLKLKSEQEKVNAEIAKTAATEEQAAHETKLKAMEDADNAYRAHRNMIGELLMQEDLARMKAAEAAHAAHIATLMQQASLTITGGASPLNARGTVSFGADGQMQTGGGSQFVPGSPVTVFDGAPAPSSYQANPSTFRGPAASLGVATATGGVTVHVDARESMYDTPAGVQRMADKVGNVIVSRLRSQGAGVR